MNSLDNILRSHQVALEEKLQKDMEFARTLIKHNGERGRIAEIVFQRLLERHLPEGFGITTGFAVDHKGNLSKQLDLMVYKKDHCPFLMNELVSVLPVEGIVLAVEVKSKLDKREFDDARAKARSLLELDRTSIRPQGTHNPMAGSDGLHVPLFLCVALESTDTKKLLASVSGEVIEPLFLSMDGKSLVNGVGTSTVTSWQFQVDYPASFFVLIAMMMVTESRMPTINMSNYIKVLPVG